MTETETTDRRLAKPGSAAGAGDDATARLSIGGATASQGSGATVRLRRDRRRQTLLDAAASAFAENGFERTSMDEVASRAGVTRLIVYRHFESKDDLCRAVVERAAEGVARSVGEHLADGPTVGGAVVGYLFAARVDPDGFRLLARRSDLEGNLARYRERFEKAAVKVADDILARRVSDPVMRSWVAGTLVALLEDATLSWLDTGDPSRDREMTSALTRSIQAMLESFSHGR